MKNINLLIVASGDMDGSDDYYNLPSDVINIEFPCSKYDGKMIEEKEMTTIKSPRCKKCHYTEVEHKYGYPLYPLHPVKVIIGKIADTGKPFYSYYEFSDFWRNKYIIFERIKFIFGDNININYNTITPTYINNLEYLPTINKINTIISNKLKLKGTITYKKPYHFSCMLDEIYKQKESTHEISQLISERLSYDDKISDFMKSIERNKLMFSLEKKKHLIQRFHIGGEQKVKKSRNQKIRRSKIRRSKKNKL